jgi:hypothetical protein
MAAPKRNLFLVVLALLPGLWFIAAPVARGVGLSPAELIEDALPAKTTMARASQADLSAAVCAVVRKDRSSGAAVTSVAVAARGKAAGDIVGSVLRCAGKVDCEYVGDIVEAAVAARPGAAKAISEAAKAQMPKCEEAIDAAARKQDDLAKTNSPSEVEKGPVAGVGAVVEEEFDPREQLALVCDDGTPRTVRQSQLDDFLHSHPEAIVGPCPPTPSPSPSPAAVRP